MKVPATEISRHSCVMMFIFVYSNIFSLKSSENKDIKPGREKHSYKKSVLVKSEAYKTYNPEASIFPLSVSGA